MRKCSRSYFEKVVKNKIRDLCQSFKKTAAKRWISIYLNAQGQFLLRRGWFIMIIIVLIINRVKLVEKFSNSMLSFSFFSCVYFLFLFCLVLFVCLFVFVLFLNWIWFDLICFVFVLCLYLLFCFVFLITITILGLNYHYY